MNIKEEFIQHKFTCLKSGVDFKATNLDHIRYKGPIHDLIIDRKDRGMFKTPKTYINKFIGNYVNFLVSSEIITICEALYETQLYPYKFVHLLSDEKTGTLAWHRDCYTHRGMQIGTIPAPIKLGIYLTDTNKGSGGTGFLPKKYQKTFDNKYIDYLYMFLFSSKAFYPPHNKGDAMLWDGTVPHSRPKSVNGKTREAVIFSLSRSLEFSKSYLNDDDSLLSRYIKAIS